MQEFETLEGLFDNKILAILAVLVNDMSEGLYLREISKFSKVSDASTYRIIQKLIGLDIVKQEKIKKLKLYTFNKIEKNQFLYKMLKKDVQVMQIFVEKIKEIPGVDAILLQSQENNKRANVLIIGTSIDPGDVKETCGEIKEKYNFVISPLVLAAEQFQQMSAMGMYSGKERVLFSKD